MGRRRKGTTRNSNLVEKEDNGLPVYEPSSPIRKPTHNIYITGPEGQLLVFSFCHVFPCKYFYDRLTDGDTVKWLDHRTVITGRGIKIMSDELEEIAEYEFVGKEQEWDCPEPYRSQISRIMMTPEEREKAREERNKKPSNVNSDVPREIKPKQERVPRASRDGLITIQAISEEVGIEPGEARAILRKAKIEKPNVGWAGDENWADNIRKVIERGMKKS